MENQQVKSTQDITPHGTKKCFHPQFVRSFVRHKSCGLLVEIQSGSDLDPDFHSLLKIAKKFVNRSTNVTIIKSRSTAGKSRIYEVLSSPVVI